MQERQNTQGMKAKKKVLLSFVGERDPFAQDKRTGKISEGSILSLCGHIRPDIIYMFPSSKAGNPERNTEENASSAEQELMKRYPDLACHIIPMEIKDATSFEQISRELARDIDIALQELGGTEEYEFHLNCSSGTPQMSAVGYVFASSGRIPGLVRWQCKDPGTIKEGEPRMLKVNTTFLEEAIILKRLVANVEGCYFHSIVEDCKRLGDITALPQRREMAKIVRKLFSAYENMDFMQYQEAFNIISGCKEKLEEFQDYPAYVPIENIRDVLKRQKDYLSKMWGFVEQGNIGESTHNLVDLYFNMERAFVRGNYVDVLSRFWRLREGMMNFRLLKNQFLDTRNLRRRVGGDTQNKGEENRAKLKASVHAAKVDWENGWIKIDDGQRALSKILYDLFEDHELLTFEQKFRNQLKKLKGIRNRTIVAHGMLPVSRDNVNNCMTLGREVVALIPGGTKIYKSYPFTVENIREIFGLLKHV